MTRTVPRAALTACLSLLLLAPGASAATVFVAADPESPDYDTVHFAAAAGEANAVVVSYSADSRSVTLTDAGATLEPGERCTAIDSHTVRCTPSADAGPRQYLNSARIMLSDGSDSARTERPQELRVGALWADGGPGDDTLAGSDNADFLRGGGGRDQLAGGPGNDTLADGDDPTAPDADVLDGGADSDIADYSARTGTLTIDLADPGTDGESGEGDAIRGVEHATGGAGDDTLKGTSGDNRLDGAGGDDRLAGRAGNDTFHGAPGGRVRCGKGVDIVSETRAGDFIEHACEQILTREGELSTSLAPYPRRSERGLQFLIRCPRDELSGFGDCRGTVRLRKARGGRLLASARLRGSREGVRTATLALTRAGRRLASRTRGVRAVVRLRGERVPDTAWTIRLRR